MKRFLLMIVLVVGVCTGRAQQSDDLTVTLPSGKVVTFQTPEQKTMFLAARAHAATSAATPATASPSPTPASMGHSALDERSSSSGKVNVSAPTFTADYYSFAPETWVGKQATLSVAYLTLSEGVTRKDGMRVFRANTWGITQANAEQNHGGYMTILATPAAAQRIATLCGTRLQYLGWFYKVSLIKGQFALLSGEGTGAKTYGMIVTQ